jgi:hypothetical protein
MCAFAFGAWSGVRMTLIPSPWKAALKARPNFASRSVDQESRLSATIIKIHEQIACLLDHPGAVGVARRSDVLDPAIADADERQHVKSPQHGGVDGEEVTGERDRGVLAQE